MNEHRKKLNGRKVLVLGLDHKKDTDDLRESLSLTVSELLQKEGAESQLQRSVLPQSWTRPQVRPEHDQHSSIGN